MVISKKLDGSKGIRRAKKNRKIHLFLEEDICRKRVNYKKE